MVTRFRIYLFRGLLILIPIGTTAVIFWQLYRLLDALALNFIHAIFGFFGVPSHPLLDIMALLIFIVLIGFFGGNFLGRKIIALTNFTINRLPIVRVIYAAIRQIVDAIMSGKKSAFSKVVLIEYPRKGIYSLGFVSADTGGVVHKGIGQDTWTVFVPTTPNPTSGVLVFVPKTQTQVLDISVDQAAKLIMSAGVIDERQEIKAEEINFTKLRYLFRRKKTGKVDVVKEQSKPPDPSV